ncbi:MAG: hypothetical protein IAG13_15220 [Deltaproteobacteria bacterium]|nr:hypothetical protein [Nannocystaceae bacterium]
MLLEPRAVVVSALASGESRVWDARTSAPIATLTPASNDARDRPAWTQISPDGHRIAAIVGDEVRVWPLRPRAEPTTVVDGRSDLVGLGWLGGGEHLIVWTETSVGTIDLRGTWTQGPWPADGVRWVEPSLDGGRAQVRERAGASVLELATGNVLLRVTGMSGVDENTLRGDGRRWLTEAADACTLWDVDAGRALATLRAGSKGCDVQGFSTDGRLGMLEADDVTTLFDAETGAVVRRLPGGLRFAASDGKRVAAAREHRVVVLDVATGRELSAFDVEEVTRLWLAAGGRRVIVRGYDELSLWTLQPTPRRLKAWRDGTDGFVALPASGTEALAFGRAARLIDLQTAESGPLVAGDLTKAMAVRWSPDGRALVIRAEDRAQVFAASDGRPLGECSPGDGSAIDDTFFVDSADHVGVLWSSPRGRRLSICEVGSQAEPVDCGIDVASAGSVSPRGRVAVLASRDPGDLGDVSEEIFVVQANGTAVAHGAVHLPTTLAWAQARDAWLVGQFQRRPVWLEDGETRPFGTDPRESASSDALRSDAVAVANDGSFAVTAGETGGVWLLDPNTGAVLATLSSSDPQRWVEGTSASPPALALSPDARRVAFIDVDRNLRVFDVASRGAVLELSAADAPLGPIAWSPEHGRLAIARHVDCNAAGHRSSEPCQASSWHRIEIREGDDLAVVAEIDAHRGEITDLAFSPDGRSLASTGADQAVRVWSMVSAADEP